MKRNYNKQHDGKLRCDLCQCSDYLMRLIVFGDTLYDRPKSRPWPVRGLQPSGLLHPDHDRVPLNIVPNTRSQSVVLTPKFAVDSL